MAAIRAYRRAQLADRLAWGSAWVDSGKVFTRENGEPLHPATITGRFHDLVAAADLPPPIRLHDLRHGAASLMLAAGVDLRVVQETLGHRGGGARTESSRHRCCEIVTTSGCGFPH